MFSLRERGLLSGTICTIVSTAGFPPPDNTAFSQPSTKSAGSKRNELEKLDTCLLSHYSDVRAEFWKKGNVLFLAKLDYWWFLVDTGSLFSTQSQRRQHLNICASTAVHVPVPLISRNPTHLHFRLSGLIIPWRPFSSSKYKIWNLVKRYCPCVVTSCSVNKAE